MQTSRRKLLLTGAAAGAGLTTSAFAKADVVSPAPAAAPVRRSLRLEVCMIGLSMCGLS